jgi:hypothetical protein
MDITGNENIPVDEILDLDERNTTPFFRDSGDVFKRHLRQKGIENELAKGARFFFEYSKGKLIGYVEFIIDENGIGKFPSIQLDSDHSHPIILRMFASRISDYLSDHMPSQVVSAAHKTNKKSIAFHKKIGFIEDKKTDDRILFQISGMKLYKNLARYGK